MKKVMDLRKWPQSIPQPSIDEVLKKKKDRREEKIKEAKRKINRIRNLE